MTQFHKGFVGYFREQAALEAEFIEQRRRQLHAPEAVSNKNETAAQAATEPRALALSGGGIRTATFSLGILRGLAKAGHLKDFDYLSTVSGGGYIGAFLGRLFQRVAGAPGTTNVPQQVESILADDSSPVLRWLRDNGRYLAPHGLKDRLFAAGIYARNMLALHVLIGAMAIAISLLCIVFRFHFSGLSFSPLWAGSFDFLASANPLWMLVLFYSTISLGCAWAYWLHRSSRRAALLAVTVAVAVAALSAFALRLPYLQLASWLPRLGLSIPIIAALFAWVAWYLPFQYAANKEDRLMMTRNRLSNWLRDTLILLMFCIFFVLMDDAAVFAYQHLRHPDLVTWTGAGITGALLAAFRTFAQAGLLRADVRRKKGSNRWVAHAINAVGIIVLIVLIFGWRYATESFVHTNYQQVNGNKIYLMQQFVSPWTVCLVALGIGLLALLATVFRDILNLSSLHNFYASRLARAYLGVGNKARRIDLAIPQNAHAGTPPVAVSEPLPDDDVHWLQYSAHLHGAPLHLINVNVNETRYQGSGDFQQDRQGWNLAIGPAGYNIGRTHWQSGNWAGAEPLKLGQWVAISGAAFTTGAGPRTGLGFSALLGLLGIRLGYWWHAGDAPTSLNKQSGMRLLCNELTGKFNTDASRYWYLSDGGHFENTAAYELIRRRLQQIVVADCGADPQYDFDDLTNLILKARIDFNAEIEFLGSADLNRLWKNADEARALFCEPSDILNRYGPALMLARIHYVTDDKVGWMLIVKPRLPAYLPGDLARYAVHHDDFPQHTTFDQFYSETQWESTHKLGLVIGKQLACALAALPLAWEKFNHCEPLHGAGWPAFGAPDEDHKTSNTPGQGYSGFGKLGVLALSAVALWSGFMFFSNWR
jgi:uncharacterized integral membrane protein